MSNKNIDELYEEIDSICDYISDECCDEEKDGEEIIKEIFSELLSSNFNLDYKVIESYSRTFFDDDNKSLSLFLVETQYNNEKILFLFSLEYYNDDFLCVGFQYFNTEEWNDFKNTPKSNVQAMLLSSFNIE